MECHIFFPGSFLLMNNFNLKKRSIKMCTLQKMACRKHFKQLVPASISKAIFESSENLRFYTMYKKMGIILYILHIFVEMGRIFR